MKLFFEKKNNIEDSFILVNRNSFEGCLLFILLYVNCSDVMFRELARNVKDSIKKIILNKFGLFCIKQYL